ncbi:hypothetical protein CLOM_g11775 [Closterium sp. NIES-68]|nr:hypothetical protein CLOM_g11775 [Closterium sp. NIES-68]
MSANHQRLHSTHDTSSPASGGKFRPSRSSSSGSIAANAAASGGRSDLAGSASEDSWTRSAVSGGGGGSGGWGPSSRSRPAATSPGSGAWGNRNAWSVSSSGGGGDGGGWKARGDGSGSSREGGSNGLGKSRSFCGGSSTSAAGNAAACSNAAGYSIAISAGRGPGFESSSRPEGLSAAAERLRLGDDRGVTSSGSSGSSSSGGGRSSSNSSASTSRDSSSSGRNSEVLGNKGRYAWATLVMQNEVYACGALVLGHSLRLAHTAADLVCMVTDDIASDVTAALGEVWDHVVVVPRLEARQGVRQRRQVRFGHMYNPWLSACLTKFTVLRMEQYEKVAFLDADMVCVSGFLTPGKEAVGLTLLERVKLWVKAEKEKQSCDNCSSAPANAAAAAAAPPPPPATASNPISAAHPPLPRVTPCAAIPVSTSRHSSVPISTPLHPVASSPSFLSILPPSSLSLTSVENERRNGAGSTGRDERSGEKQGVKGEERAEHEEGVEGGEGEAAAGRDGRQGLEKQREKQEQQQQQQPGTASPRGDPDSLFDCRTPAGILDLYRRDLGANQRLHGQLLADDDVRRAMEGLFYAMRGCTLLLSPSRRLFDDLQWCARNHPIGHWDAMAGPDEYFISKFFLDRGIPWTHVHMRYGAISWVVDEALQGQAPPVFIHYVSEKPWTAPTNAPLPAAPATAATAATTVTAAPAPSNPATATVTNWSDFLVWDSIAEQVVGLLGAAGEEEGDAARRLFGGWEERRKLPVAFPEKQG